jgi:hypothetical protein
VVVYADRIMDALILIKNKLNLNYTRNSRRRGEMKTFFYASSFKIKKENFAIHFSCSRLVLNFIDR